MRCKADIINVALHTQRMKFRNGASKNDGLGKTFAGQPEFQAAIGAGARVQASNPVWCSLSQKSQCFLLKHAAKKDLVIN